MELLLLFVVDKIESDKDEIEETSATENSLTSSRICRNSSSNSRHKLNNYYVEKNVNEKKIFTFENPLKQQQLLMKISHHQQDFDLLMVSKHNRLEYDYQYHSIYNPEH